MYRIKQLAEDFNVDEIPDYVLSDSGKYYVFKLWKKGVTTLKVIEIIKRNLKINAKDIGYAGMKDKNAVTTQFISIYNNKKLDPSYDTDNITLELTGYRNERIFLGCLAGNKFTIVVRNIMKKPKPIPFIINYFGKQRFSVHNAEIGKLIVKKEFKSAVALMLETCSDRMLNEMNQKNPNNPIAVLRSAGSDLLKIYLHAYQSLLWNRCIDIYVKKHKKNILFPIIGFGIETDKITSSIIDSVLEQEELKLNDFVLRQLPELSLEGGKRQV
ncbi:MAG: tRNA pseudouridine(13) synthase TruD, partial [Candidatus Woesearchaeota archaeon]